MYGEPIIWRGGAAEVFEFVEAAFDAISCFIDFEVVRDQTRAPWNAGNDGSRADVRDEGTEEPSRDWGIATTTATARLRRLRRPGSVVVFPMGRLSTIASYLPALLVAVALASTAADWRQLVEIGGWFAVLGHFLMVAATLVMLYLAGVLALAVAALPFVLLFCRNEDDFFALTEASRARHSTRAILGVMRRIIARAMLAIVDPPWRALWWSWWFIRGGGVSKTDKPLT